MIEVPGSIKKNKQFIEELWYISQYNPVKVNRCFGGTDNLHFQGMRVSQARKQHEASRKMFAACFKLVSPICLLPASCWFLPSACCLLDAGFLLGFLVDSEDGGDVFLRNVCFSFTGLHGVISQKTEFLIAADVTASDLTSNILTM
jgi:hypothetical protein